MIISGTLNKADVEGDVGEVIKTGVSLDDMDLIMAMTSKELYSNPIGSMIREIVSNAWDANTESGSEEAVIVEADYDLENSGYVLTVKDNGIGINEHRMNNVYRLWFKSDKRNDNTKIGGWGLGSKSPLSYREDFELITVADGYKYHYLVYEDFPENKIEPLGKVAQPEGTPTGTTVKIRLKDYSDRYNVIEQFKKQCAYFDNVFLKETGYNNEFDIFEFKHFKYREYCPFDKMHIILGKVAYPIDFNQVFDKSEYSLPFAQIPIGIKFDVGELDVTLSREQLKYKNHHKELIRKRVELAVDELIKFAEKQMHTIEKVHDLKAMASKKMTVRFSDKSSISLPDEYKPTLRFAKFPDVNVSLSMLPFVLYGRDTYERRGICSVSQYATDGLHSDSRGYYLTNKNISIDRYVAEVYRDTRIYKFKDFNKDFIRIFNDYNIGTYAFRRSKLDKRTLSINGGLRKAKQLFDFMVDSIKTHPYMQEVDLEAVKQNKDELLADERRAKEELRLLKKQTVTLYHFGKRSNSVTYSMEQLFRKEHSIIFHAELDEFSSDYMHGIKELLGVGGVFPVKKMLFVSCSKEASKKLSRLEHTLPFNAVFTMKMFHNMYRLIRTSYMLRRNEVYKNVLNCDNHLPYLSFYYDGIFKKLKEIATKYEYDGRFIDKVLNVCNTHKLGNPSIGEELQKLEPISEITQELQLVDGLLYTSWGSVRYWNNKESSGRRNEVYYKLFGHMRRLNPSVYEAGLAVKLKKKESLNKELNKRKQLIILTNNENGKEVNSRTSETSSSTEQGIIRVEEGSNQQ